MMDGKSVSVAMATYNGEKYIGQQIQSILEQTRPVDEIVISDDASTDGTRAIVERFMQDNHNIFLHTNEENCGLNANFEKAISKCRGDFVTISDQDNIWRQDRIEIMLASFKDELLVYSDSYLMAEDGRRKDRLSVYKKYCFTNGASPKEFYFYNSIFGHNVMFKKDFLDKLLPIPKGGINYDGWISFTASCVGKVKYIDEALAYFRLHSGNITHRKSAEQSPNPKRTKLERKLAYHTQIIERLTAFSTFKHIPKHEKRFLSTFIEELIRSKKLLFNPKLFLMLLLNHKSLFHMKSRYKALRKVFNHSVGLKFYRRLNLISFGKL